jgi:hypothetical protein
MAADDFSMRRSDKCVFLLGAGFSAAYGPPVMNTFMARARSNYFKVREGRQDVFLTECYEAMFEFQADCLRSSWAFNRNWDNIEELYTQADLLRLMELFEAGREATRCRSIAWAIWDVYRTSHSRPNLTPVFDGVRKANFMPVVITTNYDLVVEKDALGDGRSYFYPGFGLVGPNSAGIVPENLKAIPPDDGYFSLVKLHGSANWFLRRDKPGELTSMTTQWNTAGISSLDQPTVGIVRAVFGPQAVVKHDEYSPAIIPPMLGKMSVAPVIALQWRAAVEALATAREIWVIGYSFPATDAFMKRLLSEGIKQNRDLAKVWIVDIQRPEDWVERLDDLFTPVMRSTKVEFVCLSAAAAIATMSGSHGAGSEYGTAAFENAVRDQSLNFRNQLARFR